MTNPEKALHGAAKRNAELKRIREMREHQGYNPGHRQKLQLSQRDQEKFAKERKVLRWVNDEPGRLEEFQFGGWQFVDRSDVPSVTGTLQGEGEDVGSRVSKVVTKSGHVTRAYLMWIFQEFYDEDQMKKEERNFQTDVKARNAIHQGGQSIEGGYTPT